MGTGSKAPCRTFNKAATTYCVECERWRSLIQNNLADIDAVNSVGDTALHIAARNGKTTMALLLLEAGANAQLTNYAGETPLKMAAEGGHSTIVTALIQRGVDVNMAG